VRLLSFLRRAALRRVGRMRRRVSRRVRSRVRVRRAATAHAAGRLRVRAERVHAGVRAVRGVHPRELRATHVRSRRDRVPRDLRVLSARRVVHGDGLPRLHVVPGSTSASRRAAARARERGRHGLLTSFEGAWLDESATACRTRLERKRRAIDTASTLLSEFERNRRAIDTASTLFSEFERNGRSVSTAAEMLSLESRTSRRAIRTP
jgi:hypothetical protein